jgi:peptide/nickel transport system ATP-binding protein
VLLDIQDLQVDYVSTRGLVRAVDQVSLPLKRGETLGLAGESGCSRTNLAHAIARPIKPPGYSSGGAIFFDRIDVLSLGKQALRRFRWTKISIVCQSAMNSLNPVSSIGAQITDVLQAHTSISKCQARECGAELLRVVGAESSWLTEQFPVGRV